MMRPFFLTGLKPFLVYLILLGSVNVVAEVLSEQRGQFNFAYQSLKSNDLESFYQLSAQLQDYPLYFFLRYSYLQPRLMQVSPTEIAEFLQQYGDTGHGELLRRAWLKELAKQGDWNGFIKWYTPQKSAELQCYFVLARLSIGQDRQTALNDAKELWLVDKSQPNVCNLAFEHLYNSPLMTEKLLWQRIRLAMDKGQTALASALTKRLTPATQLWAMRWQMIHQNPAKVLAEWNEPDHHYAREVVIHGIKRLAIKEFDSAQTYWENYQRRYAFSAQQIGEMQRDLALASFKQNHPQALKWLTAVNKNYLNEAVTNARMNMVLRQQQWQAVADFVSELSEEERKTPKWRYWYARALEQLQQTSKENKSAKQIFAELAQERDYYGFLAADRIGAPYQMQDRPTAYTPADFMQLTKVLSIKSAREFYFMGMTAQAKEEWDYAMERLSPQQQAIAANLASQWNWHDRALVTAGKAKAFDDLKVRFPLAYRSQVETGAQAQGLNLGWVYGIIRQESAFATDARSRSGALGLMQLMPGTAKLVAKKIGLKLNSMGEVLDVDTNISLGTGYLRQMLDKFNGNYMLATAAYNAGPGRPIRWTAENPCLPADIWVEMIPFDETRDYVRRVLSYAKVFEARLGLQQTPFPVVLTPAEGCPVELQQVHRLPREDDPSS